VLRQSPQIAALVAEVEELQHTLVDKGDALQWLAGNKLVPMEGQTDDRGVLHPPPVTQTITRLAVKPSLWFELQSIAGRQGVAAWEAALSALMTDADAPLPA
jgi:hypothetical protein